MKMIDLKDRIPLPFQFCAAVSQTTRKEIHAASKMYNNKIKGMIGIWSRELSF